MPNPMNVQQQGQSIDSNNLKVLEDQLNYESLMVKKFNHSANCCTDTELKGLCQQASQKHKQHFDELLNYLNSH